MPVTYSSSEHLANSVLRCRTTASSMAFGPGILPITPPVIFVGILHGGAYSLPRRLLRAQKIKESIRI